MTSKFVANEQLCLFFIFLLLQAVHEKDKISEQVIAGEIIEENESYVENESEPVQSLSSQMNELAVSTNPKVENSSSEPMDGQQHPSNDIDKRIRAIKKKVNTNLCW